MHLKKTPFMLGIIFFVIFALFSYLIKTDVLNKLDFILMVKIQDKIPQAFNRLLSSTSLLAKFETITTILLLIILIRRDLASVVSFIIYGLGHIIEVVGKHALHQPTPPYMFFREEGVTFFRDYVKPGFSYPSGHAFRAVFITILLSFLILHSKKIKYKLPIITSLMGVVFLVELAKIALGQHWPTDIVGGSLLGVATGLMAISITPKNHPD